MSFHGLVAHFLLLLSNSPFPGYISSYIHSPTEGHPENQVLSIVNKVALNISVQVLFVHSFQFIWLINKYQVA